MENSIRARRKALGLSQARLSEQVGVGVPQISKWESGKVDITMSRLLALAHALECTVGDLVQETPPLRSNASIIEMEGASEERMRENLPVFGTALGASRAVNGEAIEQTTLNRAEIVHYAKRPVLLNGRAEAYGLYVQGSSMYPAHPDGSMVVVAPNMPLRIGDDVVVYLRPTDPADDDGQTARAVLIKRLVRRSASVLELEQFQPAANFQINAAEVVRIDRVLTMTELLT